MTTFEKYQLRIYKEGRIMINGSIIERVFRISYKNGTGTCFTITVENKKYLITANHVVKGIKGNDIVSIYHDSKWVDIGVNLFCRIPESDITVLTGDFYFSSNFDMPATSA